MLQRFPGRGTTCVWISPAEESPSVVATVLSKLRISDRPPAPKAEARERRRTSAPAPKRAADDAIIDAELAALKKRLGK